MAPNFGSKFNSGKCPQHSGTGQTYGVLESQPHNLTHNNIGGVGHIITQYGFMADNLSPVDPLFFLHHSNMDRLWDVVDAPHGVLQATLSSRRPAIRGRGSSCSTSARTASR